jgi:hypothetical protein
VSNSEELRVSNFVLASRKFIQPDPLNVRFAPERGLSKLNYRLDTISTDFDLLRAGNADVLAARRPALLSLSALLPGTHVLEDRFRAAFGAMAFPKDHNNRLTYITKLLNNQNFGAATANNRTRRSARSSGCASRKPEYGAGTVCVRPASENLHISCHHMQQFPSQSPRRQWPSRVGITEQT